MAETGKVRRVAAKGHGRAREAGQRDVPRRRISPAGRYRDRRHRPFFHVASRPCTGKCSRKAYAFCHLAHPVLDCLVTHKGGAEVQAAGKLRGQDVLRIVTVQQTHVPGGGAEYWVLPEVLGLQLVVKGVEQVHGAHAILWIAGVEGLPAEGKVVGLGALGRTHHLVLRGFPHNEKRRLEPRLGKRLGSPGARFLPGEQQQTKVRAPAGFQFLTRRVHGKELPLCVAASPAGDHRVPIRALPGGVCLLETVATLGRIRGRGPEPCGSTLRMGGVAERRFQEAHAFRESWCNIRRDRIHVGAEHHLGGAPLQEEVQGAVAHFHGLHHRGLQLRQKPLSHLPLLSGSGIDAQQFFEESPVHSV